MQSLHELGTFRDSFACDIHFSANIRNDMNNLFMGLYGKIRLMKMALVETVSECHFEYGYLVGHDNMAVIFGHVEFIHQRKHHCRIFAELLSFYLFFIYHFYQLRKLLEI